MTREWSWVWVTPPKRSPWSNKSPGTKHGTLHLGSRKERDGSHQQEAASRDGRKARGREKNSGSRGRGALQRGGDGKLSSKEKPRTTRSRVVHSDHENNSRHASAAGLLVDLIHTVAVGYSSS